MSVRISFYIFLMLSLSQSCVKENSSRSAGPTDGGTLQLVFKPVMQDAELNFTDEYINDWGESFTVSRFRFYVHDIKLLTSQGAMVTLSSDYFLVDQDELQSKTLNIPAPAGDYQSIIYSLGVDSARNVSGAQTGPLDPAKGMFWTWNSGYVMAKLEGHSSFSTGFNQEFTYHVGGYRSPYAVMKQITLPVDDTEGLLITKGTMITVTIKANINTWFSYNNEVKIAEFPACHSPGILAKKIADNYEGMFSIESID